MTNTGGSAGDGLSPGNTREADDHHDEPHAMGRLLFRSALLALMVPVFEGQFWNVKAIQVVLALVLCLLLYGFEKIICWLSRNRLRTKPISSAAYRGGIVYGLITFFSTGGDLYMALGASVLAYFIAMGLFKLEERFLWGKPPKPE